MTEIHDEDTDCCVGHVGDVPVRTNDVSPPVADRAIGESLTDILVRAPHFVALAVFDCRGRCVECAPILGWCKRKTKKQLLEYIDNKEGWSYRILGGG